MKKNLTIEAELDKLDSVLAVVDEMLEAADCFPKVQIQLDIAVEEIFVNIAHYAYEGKQGVAEIEIRIGDAAELLTDWVSEGAHLYAHEGETTDVVNSLTGPVFMMSFQDSGFAFDPLDKPDPDVTLPAEEREIGGLGIFMVKKSMDAVKYERKDDKNIFTMIKGI